MRQPNVHYGKRGSTPHSPSRADEAVARLRSCFGRAHRMGVSFSAIADMADVEVDEVVHLCSAGMAGRMPHWRHYDRVCRTIEGLPEPTDEEGA